MPQSLTRLHIHLIYSTKHRQPLLHDAVRDDLHRYKAAVLANIGCHAVLINSVEDHIHVLFQLSRTVAVADAVEEVKSSSSKWIKTQGDEFAGYAWQSGYRRLRRLRIPSPLRMPVHRESTRTSSPDIVPGRIPAGIETKQGVV